MTDPMVPGLDDLVRSQVAMIEDLRTRVAELETRLVAGSSDVRTSERDELRSGALTSVPTPPETSRRGFLRLAGVAAAGAAAVVVSNATPAAALTGDNAILGSSNSANLPTIVTNSINSPPGVVSNLAAIRGNGGTNSVGVWGAANGELAAGIVGSSTSGYGVYGDGGVGYSVFAAGSRARYGLASHIDGSAPPTNGGYLLGDILRNSNGDLYVCVVAGVNGTAQFRKLAGPSTAGALHLIPAARVFDSRAQFDQPGGGGLPGDRIQATQTRVINVGNFVGPGTKAVLVSLSALSTLSGGYLTAYPSGSANPGTVNCFWAAGANTAATTTVAVNASSQFTLTAQLEGAGVICSADLLGYYA